MVSAVGRIRAAPERTVMTTTTKRQTVGLFLAIVGIAAVAVGLALPWSRAKGPFTTETLTAFDLDDGVVVAGLLAVSVVGLVVYVARAGVGARWSALASFICGIAIAGIALVDIGDVASVETIIQPGGGRIETEVGEGLYLVLAGGVAQIVGMGFVLTRGLRGPYRSEPDGATEAPDSGNAGDAGLPAGEARSPRGPGR